MAQSALRVALVVCYIAPTSSTGLDASKRLAMHPLAVRSRLAFRFSITALMVAGCGSCGSAGKNVANGDSGKLDEDTADAALGMGVAEGAVTYMVGGQVFQLDVSTGAAPVNFTEKLGTLAAGSGDRYPAVSKNGEYLTISTERFDPQCSGWACTALVRSDATSGGIVFVDGRPLRSEGRVAVSNTGDLLAYAADGSPHQEDVWIARKNGASWSAANATQASPHSYNNAPVLSPDGTKVLFDCGPVPYGQAGTGVCEVGTDGSGFRQVVDPAQSPLGGGSSENQARHADYTPDGGIVFEADWASEQLWWLGPEATSPVRIIPSQSNDNSPCALPGGYIASLWLDRSGGNGDHELKITAPDGSEFHVLTPNVDIADVGMSCHALP